MSFNRWNYVESNPVNYIDPTGKRKRCSFWAAWDQSAIDHRVDTAEEIVSPNSDAINTYVAAGIAVQCAGGDEWWNLNSGLGPAQITTNETRTAYGDPINQLNWLGKVVYDANGNPKVRSYGLRIICPDTGELEPVRDPNDNVWAAELMRRRIQLVTDACKNCKSTDIYIAAALAQNGPGLTYVDMATMTRLSSARRDKYKISIDWFTRFTNDLKKNNGINTKTQLDRFTLVINELRNRGWYVPDDLPDFESSTIEILRNWQANQVIQ